MNRYRVDRATKDYPVPVGMNSLLYLGDSLTQARRAFALANPGTDTWNQPNPDYGVVLSEWSDSKRDYVVKASKHIGDDPMDFKDITPPAAPASTSPIHDPWGLSRLD